MSIEWILLCPYLTDTAGHEAEYVERLAAVAARRDHAVRIIVPRTGTVRFPGLPTEPRLDAPDSRVAPRHPVLRLGRKVARLWVDRLRVEQYRRLFRSGHGDSTWLLHTAAFPEIALVVEAFAGIRAGRDIGRLKIIVRADHHDDPRRIRQFREALSGADDHVDIYADTVELAGMMAALSPRPVGVVPIPGTGHGAWPPSPRPVRFGYFGLRRLSKGFDKLPAVLDAVPAAPDGRIAFRAIVHGSHEVDSREDHAVSNAAIASRGGVIVTDRLSGAEYLEALMATEVVVMPYDAKEYRFGSSGVFVDALHAGCVVIVAEDTWMAKESRRNDLHGVFVADFDDAGSIAAAAKQAALVTAGQTLWQANRRWLNENSPEGLFAALESGPA